MFYLQRLLGFHPSSIHKFPNLNETELRVAVHRKDYVTGSNHTFVFASQGDYSRVSCRGRRREWGRGGQERGNGGVKGGWAGEEEDEVGRGEGRGREGDRGEARGYGTKKKRAERGKGVKRRKEEDRMECEEKEVEQR